MRSDRFRPLVALALLAAAACGGSSSGGPSPTVTSVTPPRGYSGDDSLVVITGTFPPKVTVPQGGGEPVVDYTYRALLGTRALGSVTWSSQTSLTAAVPTGLAAGTYDLTVESALGERVTLKAAYEVVETSPFSATATLSPNPAAIGETVALHLSMTNGGTSPITAISAGVPSQRTTDGGLLSGFTQARPVLIDALGPGETLGFTWSATAQSLGLVEVIVTAQGTDSAGQKISAVLAAPAPVLVAAVPPGAPTAVGATPGNGSATVSWTAPANKGGSAITGYSVVSSPGNRVATAGAGATSVTVGGLTNGQSYTFTVMATNVAGTSAASARSNAVTPAAPATAPGAPTGVSATAGDASGAVNWTGPASDGGSAITGYTVTSNPGGVTASAAGSATSATVTGLANGTTYTFTVTATNSAGMEPAFGGLQRGHAGHRPEAPTKKVSTSAGNRAAAVSWTAPANGVSAITGYTVCPHPHRGSGARLLSGSRRGQPPWTEGRGFRRVGRRSRWERSSSVIIPSSRRAP